VQHFAEGFGRGAEVKAFAGRVVVGADQGVEARWGEECEVGLARQEPAHAADGVFDAALLPWRVGVAEEGRDGEAVQRGVAGKLGAVVEGDGFTQRRRQRSEQAQEMARHPLGGFVGRPCGEDDARGALVDGEHGLTVSSEQDEVGFPMACGCAIGSIGRPFRHGNTAFDEACGAAASSAAEASLLLPRGR